MTTKPQPSIEVTQADRDAAADFYHCPEFEDLSNGCREGLCDADASGLVQAFARHRLTSASTMQSGEGVEEAARALVAKLDSIDFASMGAAMWARGQEYNGPTFGEELEALRAALTNPPSARAAKEGV